MATCCIFRKAAMGLKLRRHHIGLVNELAEGELAGVTMSRKLQKLSEFEDMGDIAMPHHFKGQFEALSKSRV